MKSNRNGSTGGVIENIGPIEHVAFPCPEHGGLVVFRGRNGTGKTTALNAVTAAVTGKGKVPVMDDADRGVVECHGVAMTIGRSTRRKGEAEVVTLEGRLSVADLVDPGIAEPEAADAKRIKALVGLSGAKADIAQFAALVGGIEALEKVVPPEAIKQTDLVGLAGAVKRGFESAARSVEQRAEHERNRAAAEQAQAQQFADPEGESLPVAEAQAASESAAAELARMQAEQRRRRELLSAAELARVQLAGADVGLSVAAALVERNGAAEAVENAERAVAELTARLRSAESALAVCRASLGTATAELEAARAREQTCETLRRDVAAAEGLAPISDADVAGAAERLATARATVAAAIGHAKAHECVTRAREAMERARAAEREAARLREAAEATSDVLSAAVKTLGVPLRVKRGRLVTDTDRRGETLFAELSHGERWRLAIEVAIRVVGDGGCLVIPQEAWEGLDPTNRAALVELLSGSGVVAYTAEATDDEELTADVVG